MGEPARNILAEAEAIAHGSTLLLPEREHLVQLRIELLCVESRLRTEEATSRLLTRRLLRAQNDAEDGRRVLDFVLTTLDAIADRRSLPVDRCKLAGNAARSVRAYLGTEVPE